MTRFLIITVAVLSTSMALAGEKLAAINYYVTETKTWSTDEKAGYWGADGVSGNGICIHGSGDDTFALRWNADSGSKVNIWKILSGKGKYKGLTGQGTATTQKLPGNRRVSKLECEVDLPK